MLAVLKINYSALPTGTGLMQPPQICSLVVYDFSKQLFVKTVYLHTCRYYHFTQMAHCDCMRSVISAKLSNTI